MNVHVCKELVAFCEGGALRDNTKDGCVQTNNLYKRRNTKKRTTKGRFCEPARLSNPHKPLFSRKPLDKKPPLGGCYIVTTD